MIRVIVPWMRYQGRWCVAILPSRSKWEAWLGGLYSETMREFDTHAEAMAYADKAARS